MRYFFAMHGQPTPHNPLNTAAREALAAAREAKSPFMERAILIGMVITTGLTALVGGFHFLKMLMRELKPKEPGGHAAPASPPPVPPHHGASATAAMPPHGRDDDQGHWSKREEQAAHRHGHARQR
jgi:hypothetical protein